MRLTASQMLRRLGAGEPIASVCAAAGVARASFDAWWKEEVTARAPAAGGRRRGPVHAAVEIRRDGKGIPHVVAASDEDLFVGYGYAEAEDRLWQLDYLRRRALGTLSEILGPEAFAYDLTVRTVGLPRIAAAELDALPAETRRLVEAYAAGVNALMEATRDRLPIEFALLDYEPDPWRPLDCLAIMGEFRWYLTGRFPVIVLPELARRVLGEGALYETFLTAEAPDEVIVPPGHYAAAPAGIDPAASPLGGPDDGTGSNNWVIGPSRSASGRPLVASDPHIAFGALSCWHQVHLAGGSFNVAGAGYVGMPAVMIGRNRRVAWGVTNNLCSQRDLYLERTDPQHPRRYLYDGRWEPARERVEEVAIKGQGTVRKTVSASRHGPIVDEVLPPAARQTGPVSLRWMGATPCGWLTALLGMNRSETTDDLRTAMRPWVCPTFSVVFAGVDGRFGYQCSGRIPVRARAERGYRRGWDPADAWQGLIPVDAMPAMRDPARGFIATANNRPALADFPYPLSNTSPSGYRARRIRQLIEEQPVLTRADCQRLQYDVRLLRATEALPALLRALDGGGDERTRQARAWLHAWNGDMHKDSPAAAIFEVFFHRWLDRVIAERFSGERGTLAVGDPAAFVAGGVTGFATALLQSDPAGWFAAEAREPAIRRAFAAALAELTQRLGPDPAAWSWGRLHVLTLRHPLSGRGQLGELLDRGGEPVSGNGFTVGNTGYAPDYAATAGANHRYVTDLADDPPVMWAIDAAGTSGHPGSPHYCDQFADWLRGQYHAIPLDSSNLRTSAAELLVIGPRASA